jgi:hypothetical protein
MLFRGQFRAHGAKVQLSVAAPFVIDGGTILMMVFPAEMISRIGCWLRGALSPLRKLS